MGLIVTIVVVAAIIAAIAIAVATWRRPTRSRPPPEAAAASADPTPMTGLESALDQATDSDGNTMRERLDNEASNVDELRIPDDTGPLLRRALDHVADDDTASPEG